METGGSRLLLVSGAYAIGAVSCGGEPNGYVVMYQRQQLGDRHPTLFAAQQAAEKHAKETAA
jgi:hypothetical protein